MTHGRAGAGIGPSFDIEADLMRRGYGVIAGVDEVGRGALAGPLCIGLVIYAADAICSPPADLLKYVNDSKKLSPAQRRRALDILKPHSICISTAMVSHKVVDRLNINNATECALLRVLKSLTIQPDVVIMDGSFKFDTGIPFIPVVRGDSRSISIASASIAAKLRRDAVMEKFDLIYPQYCLKNNKGYGTSEHMESISRCGPSPIHRRSYEPVKGLSAGKTPCDDEDHGQ